MYRMIRMSFNQWKRMIPLLLMIAAPSAHAEIQITGVSPAPGTLVGDRLLVKVDFNSIYEVNAKIQVGAIEAMPSCTSSACSGWVFLDGVPKGEYEYIVTLQDGRGNTATRTVPFMKDAGPGIIDTSPQTGVTVNSSFRLAATCTDDDPAGCASLTATITSATHDPLVFTCTPDQPECVPEPGVLRLDREVSPAEVGEGRKEVTVEVTDTGGNTNSRTFHFFIETQVALHPIATVPQPILDANEKYILYRISTNPGGNPPTTADRFVLYDIRAGTHTTLPSEDRYLHSGYVTDTGAVYVVYYTTTPYEGEAMFFYQNILNEWREGQLIHLDTMESLYSNEFTFFVKEGDFVGWLDSFLTVFNLRDGERRFTNTSGHLKAVSPYGDALIVTYSPSTKGYDDLKLWNWSSGAVTTIASESDRDLTIRYATSDGFNVAYYMDNESTTRLPALFLVSPAGTERLSTRPEHRLNNGWTAFQGGNQVWLRSPAGEKKQASFFTGGGAVDALNPYGQVTFRSDGGLYLTGFGWTTEKRIGSSDSRAVWLDTGWHVISGGTLARVEGTALPALGNLNGDHRVDIADVVLVLRAAVHLEPLSSEQQGAADVVPDGSVDVNDAVKILRVIIGLDPPFPG